MALILTNHAAERWNERVKAKRRGLISNSKKVEKLLANGRVVSISPRTDSKGKPGFKQIIWVFFPNNLKIKLCLITDVKMRFIITLWPLTDLINQY